jgi:hypothetical protein
MVGLDTAAAYAVAGRVHCGTSTTPPGHAAMPRPSGCPTPYPAFPAPRLTHTGCAEGLAWTSMTRWWWSRLWTRVHEHSTHCPGMKRNRM